MNLTDRIASTGGDGAYIKSPYGISTFVQMQEGAAQRPIPISPALPITKKRMSWPPYVMLAAIVFCLDHGNVGLALFVGIYWAGWAVNR